MKKNLLSVTIAFFSLYSFGQFQVGFESVNLNPESFDNGSGGAGDFVFGGSNEISLTNLYDTAWSSWTGFAISNVTDNVTAGYGNQYSAIPGMGADSSANYAVYYLDGTIEITSGVNELAINSFKITNSTYAAISMKFGDSFAKKFGSPNDAAGVNDGTNGEDYFKVWIICEDGQGMDKDSIEYYLADYRFVDSTQDYIVNKWEFIDVSGFGFNVQKISFKLESSDNGAWGMNTPAYFAIDDVKYENQIGLGELEDNSFEMYPVPFNNVINVKGGKGVLKISSIDGRIAYQADHIEESQIDASSFRKGTYVVSLTSANKSSTMLIIK